jgi:hypothetical protein
MEETGSQHIPPQLTGNIEEQATPMNPGNTQSVPRTTSLV